MHKRHVFFILLGIVFPLFALSYTSYAVSNNIQPPFDVGTTWNVCQGYNSGGTHTGSSSISLDLTGGPWCDNSANGRNVRSPFAGTVYWYSASSGSLCINSFDGRSVMLTHIDSLLLRGAQLNSSQLVGTVAGPGQRQNNGVSHLHIQAWTKPNCSDPNSRAPFDTAHQMRICGAPDMTLTGPSTFNNGSWSGSSFTAKSCVEIPKKPVGSTYRFWSDKNFHHFYTVDHDEAQRVVDTWPDIWTYEPKESFVVSTVENSLCSEGSPVYRFWSDKFQGHFYTIDESEKSRVLKTWPDVWSYEKIAYCASPNQTSSFSTPVYRFWSDRYRGHFYTADTAERDRVLATWPDIWLYEGIRFYVK